MERKLIVELDGETHTGRERYDTKRERYLTANGFRVLRIWNSQLHESTDGILELIYRACHKGAPHPWLEES